MESHVTVTIKGISPLLMHAFPLQPMEALEKRPPEEQAEYAAYRDPDTGELYIPGINIQRSLVSAAAFSKGKGRASLQKTVAAVVFVSPERVPLGTKTYEIDARAVVVPATRGRVIRYRPRLDQWQCTFEITYDPTMLTEQQLRKVVDDAGSKVGLLDFRPEKKGPFGRFIVTEWK
jgi:hypothetical protein